MIVFGEKGNVMSVGKGRWKNTHKRNQSSHLSPYVVLLSLIQDYFDVLMIETKQKLVAFSFHLNKEHTSDRTVFFLCLLCILRNSLHCLVNADLGHLQELFHLHVLCQFFRDTHGT